MFVVRCALRVVCCFLCVVVGCCGGCAICVGWRLVLLFVVGCLLIGVCCLLLCVDDCCVLLFVRVSLRFVFCWWFIDVWLLLLLVSLLLVFVVRRGCQLSYCIWSLMLFGVRCYFCCCLILGVT